MKWNGCHPCTPVPVTNQPTSAPTEEGWAVQTPGPLVLVSSLVVTVAINTFKEHVFRYIFCAPNRIATCDIPASKEDVGTELSPSPKFLSLLRLHTGHLVVCHCLPFFLRCLLLSTSLTSCSVLSIPSEDLLLGPPSSCSQSGVEPSSQEQL